MRDLKFCGAMINGHTHGQYLDHPSLAPFWERADALGAVLYIHPADPVEPLKVLDGYPVLARPMWGWGVETGSHALRLIVGGHFERYPNVKLMLGHLGETLPLSAVAVRQPRAIPGPQAAEAAVRIHSPQCLRHDVGHVRRPAAALRASMRSGRDHVMFAADYPFEDARRSRALDG